MPPSIEHARWDKTLPFFSFAHWLSVVLVWMSEDNVWCRLQLLRTLLTLYLYRNDAAITSQWKLRDQSGIYNTLINAEISSFSAAATTTTECVISYSCLQQKAQNSPYREKLTNSPESFASFETEIKFCLQILQSYSGCFREFSVYFFFCYLYRRYLKYSKLFYDDAHRRVRSKLYAT